jgi:hypothetical protein
MENGSIKMQGILSRVSYKALLFPGLCSMYIPWISTPLATTMSFLLHPSYCKIQHSPPRLSSVSEPRHFRQSINKFFVFKYYYTRLPKFYIMGSYDGINSHCLLKQLEPRGLYNEDTVCFLRSRNSIFAYFRNLGLCNLRLVYVSLYHLYQLLHAWANLYET